MSEYEDDPSAIEDGGEKEQDLEESDPETAACELLHSPPAGYTPLTPSLESSATYPWSRWVDSLRLRKRGGYQAGTYVDGWFDGPLVDREDIDLTLRNRRPWDQVSGGTASILGTVKTASMSVPPSSAPRSRTNTITSNSMGVSRQSMESTRSSIYDAMTQASKVMAIRRRYVLREIYSSEAHYVDGLQTVIQILSTYLTMRPAILRDLQRLYETHDAFKKQLESVSPLSVETWLDGTPNRKSTILQKFQNQSRLTRNIRRRVNAQVSKEGADPSEALLVAKEVDKLTTKFHLYEAFIRSYDVLSEDLTLLRQSHPADGFWTEGIEALQKSVHSTQKRKENHKKAMTLDDLIAKPVQRVCKYQLLLTELLRTVPETTYPLTYSEIKKVLHRNSQAVDRINTVVGDPNLRIRIRKTTSLHERLDYGDQTVLENVYQELGPLILCGVLHVAYQSHTDITGQYLVCILFPGYMILAKGGSDCRRLILIASIYLSDMTVDSSMNGQGLACFDTPFSWKVIFQFTQKRYELIFSASSAAEERGWKTEILKASVMPPNEVPNISLEPRRFSCVCMPLEPLEADDRSLLLKRRGSLRTSSPRSPLRNPRNQLTIKKTYNPIYDTEVRLLHEAEPIRSRSDAKQTVSTPTVLMPLRSHRVKLERSISGIYSQELLPYPGMTLGRSDYISETMVGKTVMRGLSIRGVFNSRRSASLSKATSVSLGDSFEQDQDEQGKGSSEKGETANGLGGTLNKSKDVTVGDNPVATKTTFGSFRQKMTKNTSDNAADEESVIKSKNKPWVLWKRWLPPS